MTFEPVIARGIGWLGLPAARAGLKCSEGGPHHLGMNGDTACLDCGRPRTTTLEEKRHPMRAEIRPSLGARDAQMRRAGDE